MRPLIEELPRHYRQSPQTAELQRALTVLLEGTEGDLNLTLRQLFPSTVSGWGLELWERAWGIPVDRSQSDQQRRDRIRAKIKGTGVTTLEVIRAIAQSFSPYPVEVVEEAALYRFVIWYLGTIGEVEHKADLIAAVNELKPAHLDWEIGYRETTATSIHVGAFHRQGDTKIIWKVDCR